MKPAADTRKPYSGNTRALVIALDVGTTFSGVSYAILEPGEVPKIHGVTRFPGQEHVAGNSKIPSVMYYDRRGKMQAAGAEAESASVISQAEDEGWVKAELFKLRLRPKTMKLQMNGMQLGPLPRHKTSVDVFGDFLAYLFRCTRNFITDTHANGPSMWNAVEHDIQFVLSHPNGWEGAQQTKMRRAAVYGGLIPDTDEGKARIRFVTEGEASLHACVLNGLAADVLSNPSRHGFLVADAGGGTLDISSYAIRGTVPLVIEEIAPPDCVFSGSVFVSRRAKAFLQEKLKNSKYGTPDAVDHITKKFDETTKRLFRDKNDLQFIPFGSPLDKDPSVGIRGGQLKLTGAEVAALFEPSVEAAVASIRAQIEASQGVVRVRSFNVVLVEVIDHVYMSVWLVGGFAASPWLFSQLQERLAPLRVTVSRPDSQTSKAVADGAIGFYSDHHVSARMSKFMYGVEFLREYDQHDADHQSRRDRLCELPSGPKLLPDAFDCILSRSVKVKESTVFSRKYCTELTSLSTLSVFEVEIWCYRGGNTIPPWILRQAEEFSTLCVVKADLSPLSGSAQSKQGRNGKTYWTIVFSVEIHFGLTEFRARIKWVDNGRTRYGPASIVYNESGSRADEEEADSAPEDDFNTGLSRSLAASRGQSPAPFTSGGIRNSKLGSAIEFPRSDISPSNPDAPRGFEREKTTSRGLPTSSSAPLTDAHRGRSRRESEREFEPITAKDKGKERERTTSGVVDRNLPAHSRTTSTTSKLGEALTDVWGATKSPSPYASPLVDSAKLSQSASAKFPTPKVDLTKPVTPKVPTPKEKTRESSRIGDRLSLPEQSAYTLTVTPPSIIDRSSSLPTKTEPSPMALDTWGNDPASGYAVTSNEMQADKPSEELPAESKKAKKKGKAGSKAVSTAPTPGAITPSHVPKERSPTNEWALLGDTRAIDPVTTYGDSATAAIFGGVDPPPESAAAAAKQDDDWGIAGSTADPFAPASPKRPEKPDDHSAANTNPFQTNSTTNPEATLLVVDAPLATATSDPFWSGDNGLGPGGTAAIGNESHEDKAKDVAQESGGDWGASGYGNEDMSHVESSSWPQSGYGNHPEDNPEDFTHMESSSWPQNGYGNHPEDKAEDFSHLESSSWLQSGYGDPTTQDTGKNTLREIASAPAIDSDLGSNAAYPNAGGPSRVTEADVIGFPDTFGALPSPTPKASHTSKHSSPKPAIDSFTSEPPNASASGTSNNLSSFIGLSSSTSHTPKLSGTPKLSTPKVTVESFEPVAAAIEPSDRHITPVAVNTHVTDTEATEATDKPITPVAVDAPAVTDTKAANEQEDNGDNSNSKGKPLTKAQKKKLDKEAEEKEKTDRELLEQRDKQLAEEADGTGIGDEFASGILGAGEKKLTKAQLKKKEKEEKEKAEREQLEREMDEANENFGSGSGWGAMQAEEGPSGKPLTKAQKKKEKEEREKAEREQLEKDFAEGANDPTGGDMGLPEMAANDKDDTFGKPLTKAQKKKMEKEAKEKADRELQEQLEKELAEEAGGDWEEVSKPEAGLGGGNEDGDDKKDDDGKQGTEDKKEDKKDDDDWGLPVKKAKGKKKGKK